MSERFVFILVAAYLGGIAGLNILRNIIVNILRNWAKTKTSFRRKRACGSASRTGWKGFWPAGFDWGGPRGAGRTI